PRVRQLPPFFFSSRRRHTSFSRDWSSDVCSSDLRISPRRIDHAIEGLFGPVGGDILGVLGLGPPEHERERELADLPVIGRAFQRGGQEILRPRSIDRLYDRLAELQEQQASVRWPTMVWEDRPTVGEALRRLRSLGY